MFQKLMDLLSNPKKPPRVQVLEHRDGLLWMHSARALPLTQTVVTARTEAGPVETKVDIHSYDSQSKVYRATLTDPKVDLTALRIERRDGVRVKKVLKVLSPDLPTKEARTEDISLAGARLSTRSRLEIGEQLELTIYLAHPQFPPLRVRAEIRWTAKKADNSYHSGAKFLGINQAQMITLQNFIRARMQS